MNTSRRGTSLVASGLVGAALLASLGCPSQQVEPVALVVPKAIQLEAPAAQPDHELPSTPQRYVVDHTSPLRVATGLLVALRQEDVEAVRELVLPRSPLAREMETLLQRGEQAPPPWEWSRWRTRVWLHAGVGPEINKTDDFCDVLTQPLEGSDYHVRLILSQTPEGWRVAGIEPQFEVPRSNPNAVILADETWPSLADMRSHDHVPPTRDLAAELLDAVQREASTLTAPLGAYKAMLTPDRRDATDAAVHREWANELRQHVRQLRQALAPHAELVGSYVERIMRFAGTEADRVELRVCMRGGTAPSGLREWSFRAVFVTVGGEWTLLELRDLDLAPGWTRRARERMAAHAASSSGPR